MSKMYKSTLIKKYGTDVEVKRYLGDQTMNSFETRVLLGRSASSGTNLSMTENQKKGIFLPNSDVDNGDFIINEKHNENYVVVTSHNEYDGNKTLSIVTNLMICNHLVEVKGKTKQADDRGNLKTVFGTKYSDVPCYLEHITSQLRQFEPGISPDTEHRIYTTDLNMDYDDQLIVKMGRREMTLKVISLDYMTYPNLLVLEVAKDIRK